MKSLSWVLTTMILALAPVLNWAQPPPNAVYRSNIIPGDLDDPVEKARMLEDAYRRRDGQEQRMQAKAALLEGDNAKAFSLLQQAVSNNIYDGESCILLSYFYVQKQQPEKVIATLDPIVNTTPYVSSSVGKELTTRMMYILALLDCQRWREAVACYVKTWAPRPYNSIAGFDVESHMWRLPGSGLSHSWPDPTFNPDAPDYAGMRAQAHLILGSTVPAFMEEKHQFPYMLDHLKQVLLIQPNFLDATFLSGWMLGKMNRFAEARAAYAAAARLGTPAIQKEIHEELKKLNADEESAKRFKAYQAAMAAKAK